MIVRTLHPPTDLGNARRLVERYGADLRYISTRGWLVWDGRRWVRDETGEVMRRAKQIPELIRREALRLPLGAPLRKTLLDWGLRSESRPRLESMIVLAQTEPTVAVRASAFDADSWLLNVSNGTLDLRTAELRPHWREDLITRLAPTTFTPGSLTRRWQTFIERVMPDPYLRAFVLRALGSALVGGNRDQRLHLWIGTGTNGKSTLQTVLRRVLGDYVASADASTFFDDALTAGPRPDLARLAGARLLFVSEIPPGRRLNTSLIKGLTGGDPLTARTLFREPFEFIPTFTPFLAANHEPAILDQSSGMWRRIIKVPFPVTIPEGEQDPLLADRLAEEGPGILWWLVEGCSAWQEAGLGMPSVVIDATAAYREQSDALAGFLVERCVVDPDVSYPAPDVYRTYRAWADAAGERPVSERRFAQMLTERGFKLDQTVRPRVWTGLDLRSDKSSASSDPVRYAVPYTPPMADGHGTPIQKADIPQITRRLGGS